MVVSTSTEMVSYADNHPIAWSTKILKNLEELKKALPEIEPSLNICSGYCEKNKSTDMLGAFIDIKRVFDFDLKKYKHDTQVSTFLRIINNAISDCLAFNASQAPHRLTP